MNDGSYPARRARRRVNMIPSLHFLRVCEVTIPKTSTVIDLGAGAGRYVIALRDLGYQITGLDGCKEIAAITAGLISCRSLAVPCQDLYGRYDWAIFTEVGEHVPKEFEPVLVDNVTSIATSGLLVTWARPGQRGYGHVNCRSKEYVTQLFHLRGWKLNEEKTERAASVCSARMKHKIMVFTR